MIPKYQGLKSLFPDSPWTDMIVTENETMVMDEASLFQLFLLLTF